MNKHFTKEIIQIANKHALNTIKVRAMHIKTTIRHHYIVITIANIKKADDTKVGNY